MSRIFDNSKGGIRKLAFAATFAMVVSVTWAVHAQPGGPGGPGGGGGFGNFFQTVGGIRVDASGVLRFVPSQLDADVRREVDQRLNEQLDPAVLSRSDMRMISLREIEKALKKASKEGEALPDEVKFMAGIQRIEYVFVFPEEGDIVLAGPGEGWQVNERGDIVGKTTGQPVIRLEDFIVAMRTVDRARQGHGISVSIDPTQEGVRRVQALTREIKQKGSFQPKYAKLFEKSMGPQQVSLTGVPEVSRYAQVLVAADYRMKRLAMGFDPAPVDNLPSILEIAQRRGSGMNRSPRFWLECKYDAVKKSGDGLSWQLSGPGAKALTQEEALGGDDHKQRRSHPIAKQWAESMTDQFAELTKKDVVFAELRNILDMSVVAALIRKERLLDRAELELPLLLGQQDRVELPEWQAPQVVPSMCSYARVDGGWMVTASGGIQVDSWSVLDNTEIDDAVRESRDLAASSRNSSSLWWNGK